VTLEPIWEASVPTDLKLRGQVGERNCEQEERGSEEPRRGEPVTSEGQQEFGEANDQEEIPAEPARQVARVSGTTGRTRNPWTTQETENLVRGTSIFGAGSWTMIKDHLFAESQRTNRDLKDKWRNLLIKGVLTQSSDFGWLLNGQPLFDRPLRDLFPEAVQQESEPELTEAPLQPTPVVQRAPLTIRHLANAANVTEDLVRVFLTVLHRRARYASHFKRDVLQEVRTAERINKPTWRRFLQAFRDRCLIVPVDDSSFSAEDLGDLFNDN